MIVQRTKSDHAEAYKSLHLHAGDVPVTTALSLCIVVFVKPWNSPLNNRARKRLRRHRKGKRQFPNSFSAKKKAKLATTTIQGDFELFKES